MSEIRPFAALRFARDPEPRLAPPWDVISEEDRARLAREPVVRRLLDRPLPVALDRHGNGLLVEHHLFRHKKLPKAKIYL